MLVPDHVMIFYSQLARQGLNVVLMSRSNQKLQKVADEISEYPPYRFATLRAHYWTIVKSEPTNNESG